MPIIALVEKGVAGWLRRIASNGNGVSDAEVRVLAPVCAGFVCLMVYTYAMQPVRDAEVVVVGREHLGTMTAVSAATSLVASSAFGAACVKRGGPAVAVARTFRAVAGCCAGAAALQLLLVAGAGAGAGADTDTVASPARRLLGACVVVGGNTVAPLVMSLLWGFAADTFSPAQAVRLFAYLAAACSLGQFVGSLWATAWTQVWQHFAANAGAPLAIPGDTAGLLVSAAAALHCAAACVARVPQAGDKSAADAAADGATKRPARGGGRGGGLLDAAKMVARSRYLLAICSYTFLYICTGSLVYFERMAQLPAGAEGAAFSARVTARLGLASAVLVLALQGSGLSSRAIGATGVAFALALPAAVTVGGFLALARYGGGGGGLAVVCALDVARRLANYALAKPVREALFAVVPTEEKYGAKSLIDTAFNRFGSLAATAIFYGVASPAAAGVALAAAWWWVALFLARERARRADAVSASADGS